MKILLRGIAKNKKRLSLLLDKRFSFYNYATFSLDVKEVLRFFARII